MKRIQLRKNIRYILDATGNPVAELDLMAWAAWFEESCKDFDKSKRRVGDERIGRCRISTVFLGLDHNYGEGAPILWETAVFKKESPGKKWIRGDFTDVETDRCSGSREQAEAMHQKMVKLVKEKYGNRQRKPKLKNKAG